MNKKHPDSRAGARGFTLIEVMVALAITALGMVAIVIAARSGLANAALSGRYVEATRRAESRLAEVGVAAPLVPGEASGSDGGGFSWHRRISPPAIHPVANGDAVPALYDVEVDISWQDITGERSVTLRSQRFATIGAGHG